jgi:ribosome-associated toxin RatA of RatAB toxin-antitoxin module
MFPGATIRGGRKGARRFLSALFVVVLPAVPGATGGSTSGSRLPEVSVREQGGVYSVSAEFSVPQPASAALAVLTDYEQISRFMPGVTTSIVRERSEERVVIEARGCITHDDVFEARVLAPRGQRRSERVALQGLGGRSFSLYDGAWRLSQVDGQTAIRYELRARSKFDVPGFLLKRLLTCDAKMMIERLRREIAVRHGSRFSALGTDCRLVRQTPWPNQPFS